MKAARICGKSLTARSGLAADPGTNRYPTLFPSLVSLFWLTTRSSGGFDPSLVSLHRIRFWLFRVQNVPITLSWDVLVLDPFRDQTGLHEGIRIAVDVEIEMEFPRKQRRPYLFSFAGARRSKQKRSIRAEIIKQRQASNKLCNFLDCDSSSKNCDGPANLMNLFPSSIFCLEPPGDPLTRRSTFDSIFYRVGFRGFFHIGNAYAQSVWH
ncbi:hypothetical protein V6N13_026182 [Hibiscus sabdariffa]|uniref:Exostosin GT47 domain-containing protein n=1 Tax=Hibiscus sabdariffa TaxID=183260 RepID=A0ABR2P5L9_9ROSI